jgi:hypothetical protein
MNSCPRDPLRRSARAVTGFELATPNTRTPINVVFVFAILMVVHFPATSFINDHSDEIKGYAVRHDVKFLVAAERLWEHLTKSRRDGYLEIARARAGTAAVISPECDGGSSGRGGAGSKQHPRGGLEDDDDSADSSSAGDDHENVKQKSRKSLRDKNAPKKKSKQLPGPLPGRGGSSSSNNKTKQKTKKASISAKAANKKKWSTRTGGVTGRTISWNIFLKGTKMNSAEASVYWKKLTKAEKDAYYDSKHRQGLNTEDKPLKEEEDEVVDDHSMQEAHDDNDGELVEHAPDQDNATSVPAAALSEDSSDNNMGRRPSIWG